MTPAVPRSELADTVMERLTALYPTGADPVRAAGAAAYMKGVAPFLGIYTAERRVLSRTVLAGLPAPDETDCTAIALRCWALPEREYAYFAADYLRRHVRRCSSGFLPVVRRLVTTVSWWDTVDALAAHVVGPLVAADPALRTDMDAWIDDDDLWVARTALLHQLRYKESTDTGRLFGYCLRRGRPPRLLHPQGDRLVPAGVRQDRPRRRTGLRRLRAGPALPAVGTGSAEEPVTC